MTDKQAKDATESILWTISAFQIGYKTIRKENPGIPNEDVIKLTEVWWGGVMAMIGYAGSET